MSNNKKCQAEHVEDDLDKISTLRQAQCDIRERYKDSDSKRTLIRDSSFRYAA